MDIEARSVIVGHDESYAADFQATVDEFDEGIATLEELGNEEIRADASVADEAHATFQESVVATLTLVEEGDVDGAKANSLEATDPAIGAAIEILNEVEGITADTSAAALSGANSTKSSSTTIVIVVSVIAVLSAAAIAYWIATGITGGVKNMLTAAEGISEGDLEQNVDVKSNDEIGEMANAFGRMIAYLKGMAGAAEQIADGDLTAEVHAKSERDTLGNAFSKMVENLRDLVGQVSETSDGLAASKDQLSQTAEQAASATQDVAKGAAQVAESSSTQSTSAVEVNKAFEALAQSVDQIVKGSEAQTQAAGEATSLGAEVTESAEQMTSTAEKGVVTVEMTIQGMTKIRNTVIAASEEISRLGERSTEIGKIVSVIDDIAAQTNLLALNAAIEAARAGEQGRGFAVVAEEVRSLAERVAAATKEIADLIGGVQESVTGSVKAMEEGSTEMETGSKLASEAGDEMQRVLAAAEEAKGKVEQITAVIGNISAVVEQNTAATQEMKAIASQVGKSIETIASIAQENNATTEEVSASAQEMSSQVEETTAATHTLGIMADDLRQRVSVFKLGGNGNGRQVARSAPVHPDGGEEFVSTDGEGNEEAGRRPRAARSTNGEGRQNGEGNEEAGKRPRAARSTRSRLAP